MKILIIHYRYYEASGPEKYLFKVSRLLESNGHIVIPFSLNYSKNIQTRFTTYFPKPLVDNFHINQHKKNIPFTSKIKILLRSAYNNEVFRKLMNLLETEKPDVVYVLQYAIKLSISIFDACEKYNIPVVLRLSDFNLICAKNICYRSRNTCIKCVKNPYSSVKYSCVHDSKIESFIYYIIQRFNWIKKFQYKIDAIIAPSKFTIEIVKKSKKYSNLKYYHIPTFIDNEAYRHLKIKKEVNLNDGINLSYWGRIEEDKGIDILILAIKQLSDEGYNVRLKVFGDINSEYAKSQIKIVFEQKISNIKFYGYVSNSKIYDLVKETHFSIIPSRWFDNMPNTLIESCLFSIPPIVSNIGSFKELIEDNKNGFSFEPVESVALVAKIKKLFDLSSEEYLKVANNCRMWILKYANKTDHLIQLVSVFQKVINEKNSK